MRRSLSSIRRNAQMAQVPPGEKNPAMNTTSASLMTSANRPASINFTAQSLRWSATAGGVEVVPVGGHDSVRISFAATGMGTEEFRRDLLGTVHLRTWRVVRPDAGVEMSWSIGSIEGRSGFVVQAGIRNIGSAPFRLRRFILLDGAEDALRVDGDPAAWFLDSPTEGRFAGDLATVLPSVDEEKRRIAAAFNMPAPAQVGCDERRTDGRWRTYRDWATLTTDDGHRCLAIGPWGVPTADLDIACRVDCGRVRVAIASEMTDVVVEPGETRSAQGVAILWGDHDICLADLFRAVAATHGSRTHRGPAVGWCSWYHTNLGVAPADIIGIAGAADHHRLPMPVVQIDDGWQNCYGDWRRNQRFAGGWQPCLDAIARRGSTPGIWVAPLRVARASGLIDAHPEWMQRRTDGRLHGQDGDAPANETWIDPTHPQARAWIRDVIAGLRRDGFTYFKIDFNHVHEGVRLHDAKKTRFQALRDLYALYRETIGEDAYLLGCLGLSRAVCGHADAVRIGPDACSIWRAEHPCTIETCIRATIGSSLANGILWANDPDVAYTAPVGALGEPEVRTWLGHVSLLGGSVLTSDPFHTQDTRVGSVSLQRQGADLLVEAQVIDAAPVLDANPWCGSSIEVFTTRADGGLRQHFLLPGLDGQAPSGRVIRSGSPGIHSDASAEVASEVTPGGWTLRARLRGVAEHVGFAVEAKINAQSQVAGPALPPSHVEVVIHGAPSAYCSTAGYTPLADGGVLPGTATYRGRSDGIDAFARMVPPAPERATPWRGGMDRDGTQVGFIARRDWGSWAVVQMHNPGDASAERCLRTDGLEVCGPRVHAFEFWSRRWLGVVAPESIRLTLPAHGPALLRLTPTANGLPVLVGSTLHYAQGAAEIAGWRAWSDGLVIDLHDHGSATGSLYLHDEADLAITSVHGLSASLVREGGIWRIDLAERQRGGGQQIVCRRTRP
jgi:hypothetical protein